jgi:hypothetical protein
MPAGQNFGCAPIAEQVQVKSADMGGRPLDVARKRFLVN